MPLSEVQPPMPPPAGGVSGSFRLASMTSSPTMTPCSSRSRLTTPPTAPGSRNCRNPCVGKGVREATEFSRIRRGRPRPWNHDRVPKPTPAKRALDAGLAVTALGGVLLALHVGGYVVLLPGLVLCVSAAAISASMPPQHRAAQPSGPLRGAPRGSVVAVCVLGGLILLPIATIGALWALDADPLGIFLVGLGLFSLAGVLAVTFLAVFFINAARTRRSADSPSIAPRS